MDFDEYDYLEKTVEKPEVLKVKEITNGGEENLKSSGERDRGRSGRRRSDENEYDADYRRSKLGEKSRDHGWHGLTRHRSRSRDGERDRHKSSREQKDRERDRERGERNRMERERDRGKDREHGRDRDRRDSERGRERERDRERLHQSRSHTDRHEGNQDGNERGRNQDKDRKEEDRERELGGHEQESRGHKDKKDEAKEPEVDPERDQRTVFAYQLSLKADERDVYEFFSRAGKVRDVRLIMDRNSRRSKGVGYVEFYDAMSVPMAIALSGQPLLGLPVMVKPSEAEKNLVQSTTSASGAVTGSIGPYSGGARRLYVGNLHTNLTSDQLKKIFEPFGDVELVQLPLDGAGQCKGFGFVQFTRLEDAQNALSLNGLEIAGRTLKVSAVTNQSEAQDVGPAAGDFDDDEDGGLSLNASSRAMLMQKLAGSSGSSFPGSVGTPGVNGTEIALSSGPTITGMEPIVTGIPPVGSLINSVGTPSECLLLKNMFDPKLETEPDFDLYIKDDVEEEASKFGNLKHIYVDKNTAGFVYLRFENAQSAVNAQRALHGRWFAQKMITATFVVPQNYEAKFPESS